jgi:hypothetical protein
MLDEYKHVCPALSNLGGSIVFPQRNGHNPGLLVPQPFRFIPERIIGPKFRHTPRPGAVPTESGMGRIDTPGFTLRGDQCRSTVTLFVLPGEHDSQGHDAAALLSEQHD